MAKGRLSGVSKALKALRKKSNNRKQPGFLERSARMGYKGYFWGSMLGIFGGKDGQEIENDVNGAVGSEDNINDSVSQNNKSASSFPDLQAIKVQEIIIKPKLGPHEGKYARHLNLIIERQAKLESAVRTQNNLITKYNSLISASNEQGRIQELDRKRREDEQDLENKKSKANTQSGLSALRRTIESKSDSILRTLGKIALGGAAGYGLYNMATGQLTGQNMTESAIDLAIGAVDTVDAGITAFTDTVVPATAAYSGAKTGTNITQAAINQRRIQRNLNKSDIKAQARGEMPAKRSVGQKIKAQSLRAVDAIGKPINARLDPRAIRAEGARLSNIDTARRYARAQKFVQGVRQFETAIKWVQSGSEKAGAALSRLRPLIPDSIYNKVTGINAKKIVKWYLIGESIVFLLNAAEAFATGTIGEDEWHEQNKDQINRIFMTLGGPFACALILGAAGTVVPIVGNLAGGFTGFLIGFFLGDDVYRILQLDDLVDATYDAMLGRKTFAQAMTSFGAKISSDFVSTFTGADDEDQKTESPEGDATSDITGSSSIAFGTVSASTADLTLRDPGSKPVDELVQSIDDQGFFQSSEDVFMDVAKNIHTEEKLREVSDSMKEKSGFDLFTRASLELSYEQYRNFENLIKANIADEKKRKSGELVADLDTFIRPESEEQMQSRYGDKTGTSLIADVLGEGIFDLEGTKGEMLSAFKDVSSWDEYDAIKQKYMDEYGKDLTNELKFFLGEDGFNDLLELIKVNIENRFKTVKVSEEIVVEGASRNITQAELSSAETYDDRVALAKEIAISPEQFESVLKQLEDENKRLFWEENEVYFKNQGRQTAVVDTGPLAEADQILGETKNWWEMDNLEKGVGSRDNPEGYDYSQLIRGPEETQVFTNEREAKDATRSKTQGFIEQEKDQAYWNKALAGAKEKGIYDSDLIGYSELESDRIGELTDDEIVAILHHSDLERSMDKDSPFQMLYSEYNKRMDAKRQNRYAAEETLPGRDAVDEVVVDERGRKTNEVLPMPSKSEVMSETSSESYNVSGLTEEQARALAEAGVGPVDDSGNVVSPSPKRTYSITGTDDKKYEVSEEQFDAYQRYTSGKPSEGDKEIVDSIGFSEKMQRSTESSHSRGKLLWSKADQVREDVKNNPDKVQRSYELNGKQVTKEEYDAELDRIATGMDDDGMVVDAGEPVRIEEIESAYESGKRGREIEPRAKGGPVKAGKTYLVGEEGPEAYDPNAATDKKLKIMKEYGKDWKKASAARKEKLSEIAKKEGRTDYVQWEAERISMGRWTDNMIQFGGVNEWIRLTEIGDGNAIPGVPGWTIQNGYPAKGNLALTKAEGELRLEEEEKADIASGTVLAKEEDVAFRDNRLRVRTFNGEESMFTGSETPEYVKNYMKNNERIKNKDGSITYITEARAKGGPVEDGSDYLVGEEGPELMVPKQDGFIIPADTTKEMLSGLAGYRKNGGWVEKGRKYLTGEESVEMNIPSADLKSIIGNMSTNAVRDITNLVPIMMPITHKKPNYTSIAGANGPSKGGTSAISYRTKDSFLAKYETT